MYSNSEGGAIRGRTAFGPVVVGIGSADLRR